MSLKNELRMELKSREQAPASELALSIAGQANAAHGRFLEGGRAAVLSLVDQVNAAREAGIFLKQLKDQTRHGEWLLLFKTAEGKANPKPVLDFDAELGRIYMRIAEKQAQPVTELAPAWQTMKDVMIGLGALSASSRGLQQSHGHLGPFASAEKKLMGFWSIIGKEREKADVSAWPEETRSHLKDQIRPFVELYELL